jgi:hypothetical protein
MESSIEIYKNVAYTCLQNIAIWQTEYNIGINASFQEFMHV